MFLRFHGSRKIQGRLEVYMPTVTPIHSPLTDNDITRLPKGQMPPHQSIPIPVSGADTVELSGTDKSHTMRNTIIGLVIAAAAIVGLKHCSFMQIKDVSNMKWYDHIKSWNNKLGEWIEKPFVWTYNKIRGTKSETPAAPAES